MSSTEQSRALLVILGNQLFALEHLPPATDVSVFMAEDLGLCTDFQHHQQKIVLFLAAMRNYADGLRADGYDVRYDALEQRDESSYEEKLTAAIEATLMLLRNRIAEYRGLHAVSDSFYASGDRVERRYRIRRNANPPVNGLAFPEMPSILFNLTS